MWYEVHREVTLCHAPLCVCCAYIKAANCRWIQPFVLELPIHPHFHWLISCFLFTARRLAKRGICRRRVSVCVSVYVSVTLRYCIKTAKRRITQTTPNDSPMILVFWCQRSWRNSNGITPYGGDKCRWGRLKLVTFDEKRAITRKRYNIDA